MTTRLEYTQDPSTGIAYVRPASLGMRVTIRGIGHITYRCHTCGDLIHKDWEVLFVDPVTGWIAPIHPVPIPTTMTTHHAWHLPPDQED